MDNEKNTQEFPKQNDETGERNVKDELIKTQIFSPNTVKNVKKRVILGKIKAFFEFVKEKFFIFCERFALSLFYGTSLFTAGIIIICLAVTLSAGITLCLLSLVFGIIYFSGFMALGVFEIGAAIAFLGFALLLFTLFLQVAKIYLPFVKNEMKPKWKKAFEKKDGEIVYE